MAEALDFEQAAVGGKADLAQVGQVDQTLADAEVVGVVDGRFGAQGALFLVILLDPRALVIDVQGGCGALGEDAGSEPSWCGAGNLAVEDELDLLGATEVEIFA